MKAVALVGSYRRGGLTDQAVAAILRGAEAGGAEVHTIHLTDQHIEFCTNCRSCTQGPGDELGTCVLDDDMASLIRTCASADVLVLAAPVNVGTTTALMKRFMERLVVVAHWPWGQPGPRMRNWAEKGRIGAVLVTSSAAPAILGRLAGFRGLKDLRSLAKLLGARVLGTRWYGMVSQVSHPSLSEKQEQRAFALGRQAVRLQSHHLKRLSEAKRTV